MRSIRARLTAMMVMTLVVSLCIMGVANYLNVKDVVVKEAEGALSGLAQNNSEKMGLWLDARKAEIGVLTNSPILKSGDAVQILPYLKEEVKRNPVYARFLVVDLQGNAYYTNDSKAQIADREYFQQAKAGKMVVSDPVVSKVDGKMVVVVAGPIMKDGKVVGVTGGTITIDDLVKMAGEIRFAQSGYAFVVQRDGLMIMHPNKELIMKDNPLTDPNASADEKALTQKMVGTERGLTTYTYKGLEKYIAYALIPGTTWTLGVNAPAAEVTAKLKSLLWLSMALIVVVMLLAAFVARLQANSFARPIQELNLFAGRIAGCDLSETKINISSEDEIGELGRSFGVMAQNLQTLIKKVTDSSQQVAASAQELTASSQQASQASDHVANAIEQMASETGRQVTAIDEATELVGQISEQTAQTAQSGSSVLSIVKDTAAATQEGRGAVTSAINEMENIGQKSGDVEKAIAELASGSREIGEIVELISSIAGQTNLLALNAAIEAARAGEQGRGFAVVADEVRKLAEQSNQAAQKIGELIRYNEEKMTQAVAATKSSAEGIKSGVAIVTATGETFRRISASVDNLSGHVREIAEAVGQIAAGNKRVSETIRNVQQRSQTNSDNAQSISAATEEQAASMQEIASASQMLAETATELQLEITKFRV